MQLRSALDYVSEITGKVVNEEVLNMIFDRFCIGNVSLGALLLWPLKLLKIAPAFRPGFLGKT
jgi:hypothetical protein